MKNLRVTSIKVCDSSTLRHKIYICSIIVEHRVAYSAKILSSHFFLMSRKFKVQSCQRYGVKWIIFIFADKGNSETKFGKIVFF